MRVLRYWRTSWDEGLFEPRSWARCECGWSRSWPGVPIQATETETWWEHDGRAEAAADAHRAGHRGERYYWTGLLDRFARDSRQRGVG